jgi:hypothetical protein
MLSPLLIEKEDKSLQLLMDKVKSDLNRLIEKTNCNAYPLRRCWKSASLAEKRIRFGTNRVTISEPIGWNHRRVIQLPCDLHLIHIDIRPKLFSYCLDIGCVYLILSLFPTDWMM